jgi:hypothetical protein
MQNPLRKLPKPKKFYSVNQYLYNKTHPTPPLTFFSVKDSIQACNQWVEQLPNDFDIIIGVPRAGLMFANIIACKFGRPLTTPDNFLRGELWFSHDSPMPSDVKKVLIVEDSVGFGKQITSVTKKIKAAYPHLQVETAGLFVIPQSKDLSTTHMRLRGNRTFLSGTFLLPLGAGATSFQPLMVLFALLQLLIGRIRLKYS